MITEKKFWVYKCDLCDNSIKAGIESQKQDIPDRWIEFTAWGFPSQIRHLCPECTRRICEAGKIVQETVKGVSTAKKAI